MFDRNEQALTMILSDNNFKFILMKLSESINDPNRIELLSECLRTVANLISADASNSIIIEAL